MSVPGDGARVEGAGPTHARPARHRPVRHHGAGWGKEAAVVARAVLPHPGLWWATLGAVRRLSRRGWWRRAPFLPLPGEAYWRFRLVTAYGGTGEGAELSPSDVIAYVRWCQRSRPRRG